MPVVASNRGLKTGNTDDQYKQIYRRTYNHVIKNGKAAALTPLPDGLGSAYTDAFRHGRRDATASGTFNSRLQFLLTQRIERFKAVGIRTLQEECEKHCLQLAHKWLYDVFGSRARNVSMFGAGVAQRSYGHGAMIGANGECSGYMQRGFGGASEKAKTMLEQKLEDKYKQLMKKMEKTRRWNSYMTDDLRRAESDCLELIEDEPSRQAVHAALEKARIDIQNYHNTTKKAKLLASAAAAYTKLMGMLTQMGNIIDNTKSYTTFQRSIVYDSDSLKQFVNGLTRRYATAVSDTKPPKGLWPSTNAFQFYKKDNIDKLVEVIYKDTTSTYSKQMVQNKYAALAYIYLVLTLYRQKVIKDHLLQKKKGRPKVKVKPPPKPLNIIGKPAKLPSGKQLTLAQKAALAAESAKAEASAKRIQAFFARQKAIADAKAAAEAKAAADKAAADKAAADAKAAADKAEAKAKAEAAEAAERKELASTTARQQQVKKALEQAMKDAARDTTLDQMYCEKQKGVMCLQHSINNIVGQPLFKKADFFNNNSGEGYRKRELDRLLMDNGEHPNATNNAYNRRRNRVYMRESGGQGNVSVLTEQELEHVLTREDFLGLIVGKPGHWVAIKRVIIGNTTVYVQLDSVGQKRIKVATDANSLHNYINTYRDDEGKSFTPTVDVVYAWSGYELLEHELRVHDALDVLVTYANDFKNHDKDKRAKIKFEFIILGVDKDKYKNEINAFSDTSDKQAMKVYIEHLQMLYEGRDDTHPAVHVKLKNLVEIAAQAVANSVISTPGLTPVAPPVAPPVITPVVPPAPSWQILQPDALSTSMSDAFAEWMSRTKEESESEDSEGEKEEDAWEPIQEAMEAALDQGWAAWRKAQEESARGASNGSATNFTALLEAPVAALPSPLQFMDHADAASYVAEGAPPSPPRIMIR